MLETFKDIHVGRLIKQRMQECNYTIERAAAFLNISEDEVQQMYECKSLDSHILLRWSKLLQYDFFRIYTQHLILYSPQDKNKNRRKKNIQTKLPEFKKNIYT